jgi:two-component system CheB/CheR fusion protein
LSGDVVDLVRPELRFELRSALNRLYEQNLPTLSLPIMVRFNGSPHRVHVLVKVADGAEAPNVRHAVIMLIEGEGGTDQVAVAGEQATGEAVRRLT